MRFASLDDKPDLSVKRFMTESGSSKMRPTNLMLAIKDLISMRFWSRDTDYKIDERDLAKLYEIFNDQLFSNRLSAEVAFFVYPESKKTLTRAAFKVLNDGKVFIEITQLAQDNLYWVANALLHEMIHLYDYMFGVWSLLKDKYKAVLDPKTRKFTINGIDLHSGSFAQSMKLANQLGMNVQVVDHRTAPFAPDVDFEFVFEDEGEPLSDEEMAKIIEDSIITDGYKKVVVKDGKLISITVS